MVVEVNTPKSPTSECRMLNLDLSKSGTCSPHVISTLVEQFVALHDELVPEGLLLGLHYRLPFTVLA